MMKLFGAFGPAVKKGPQPEEDIRYTRFSYHKTRETAAPAAEATSSHVRRSAMPAAAHRPASNVARATAPAPEVDENAHLYSETRVSVAVLRNALPQRFAESR